MATAAMKSIQSPDETRTFDKGHVDLVTVGDLVFGKATFEPGWKVVGVCEADAGTNSCEVHHNGYIESGRMHLLMDDGTEFDFGPGDVFVAPPGHDAWIVGNEPCIAFDFSSDIQRYAKS
jgi:mannose-6-phosphate isomerase-like protein (cupin superfamily)